MLIKTIAEVKELVPVSVASDMSRINAAIINVERDYVRPVIGSAMFDELQEYYDLMPVEPPHVQSPEMEALLKLVQNAIIHLAYWNGYEILNAYISDGGFKRTDGDKIKGLYRYQEDNLKDYFRTTGFNALDSVLAYLETEIEYFTEFSSSDIYKSMKLEIIRDTATFDSIYSIGNSRLTFMRLRRHMQTILDLSIIPTLGRTNYELVKTELAKDAPSADVSAILPYLRKPLAYLSVAMLMEESGADLSDKGLYFESKAAITVSDGEKKPTEITRVLNLVKRERGIGESYLAALQEYMIISAKWGAVPTRTGTIHNRNNDAKKSIWV